MAQHKYAVLGAGLMGIGIATTFARFGHEVLLYDNDPARLKEIPGVVDTSLNELIAAGKFAKEKRDEVQKRLSGTANIADVASAELLIEAVFERIDVKHDVYNQVEAVVSPDAVIASNTSGLPPDDLAAKMKHPERLLIAHFWNPPHFVPLVELVPGTATKREHLLSVQKLMNSMDLEAVVLDKAAPGFVGNRIQFAILREALHIVRSGIASAEVVDLVTRSTFGRRFPMLGELEVADMGGLGTFLDISRSLMPHLAKDESCLKLLEEMVDRGEIGLRSGKGFYVWDDARKAQVAEKRIYQLKVAPKP